MSSASWGLVSLTLALASDPEHFVILQTQGPASIAVAGTKTKELRIPLSGSLRLRLVIEGKKDLEVQPLQTGTRADGWQLVSGKATLVDRDGRRRWQQEIQAEPLKPGSLALTLPPLRYRSGSGSWQMVAWDPLRVKIQTTALADVKDLRDITNIEELPGRQDRNGWIDWIGPAGAMALVVLMFVAWRWRGSRPAAVRSPEQKAQRELERIAALKLVETGKAARFHALLHDVVRRYLRRRFQVSARARTSDELRSHIVAAQLPSELRQLLDTYFERCDWAKFAGDALSSATCQETAELARRIVSSARLNSTGEALSGDSPARDPGRESDGS